MVKAMRLRKMHDGWLISVSRDQTGFGWRFTLTRRGRVVQSVPEFRGPVAAFSAAVQAAAQL